MWQDLYVNIDLYVSQAFHKNSLIVKQDFVIAYLDQYWAFNRNTEQTKSKDLISREECLTNVCICHALLTPGDPSCYTCWLLTIHIYASKQ